MRSDGTIDVRRINGTGRATLPAAYVREHVELGYATTAHRAQGRTVDTAHAFVSATTLREPLYVMATRGRESNRLYVDTMYDPDIATSHEPPEELAPADVLRYVLASSGADKSATLTITDTWTEGHSIARLWAEYDTIARHANEDRYAAMVASSGLTPSEADTVRASEAWGPLMAAFREAESRPWISTAPLPRWFKAEPSAARTTSPHCSTAESPNGSNPQVATNKQNTLSACSQRPQASPTRTWNRRWRIAAG